MFNKVIISNKKEFEKKISKLKEDGFSNLHVVSDFDRTLTKSIINGRKTPSGIALIREGNYLTEDYPKKAFDLFKKYHPFEIDSKVDPDFRNKMMIEWWQTHVDLMVESEMNKSVVEDIIKRYNKIFRDKTSDLLTFLNKKNIPLLIFSSGLGDLIEGFLKKENLSFDNISIIANFYNYKKDNTINGYKGNIIHVFNKSKVQVENQNIAKVRNRTNLILLGDSIGDLGMSKGLEHDCILKIAFLNEKIEERLDDFKKEFDVIITNDGSMEYVFDLISSI